MDTIFHNDFTLGYFKLFYLNLLNIIPLMKVVYF